MSQKFIDEVRSIVISNLSDEKFGVRELSSLLGLSASQTLRKVKAATGKSVNQYIRELRLEKAAKLLKKTDLSIAEVSYKVGFGSSSYFNTVFNKYYGITPGEYKTKSLSLSELTANKPKNKSREVSLKMKIFYPVIITLVFVIAYLLVNNLASKNTTLDNSIAVLPFKDFSPEDSQWFSDGVSDNILHSLAQMNDLSVISFTSSSTYRNTEKQIPEIAKELGVSYILEGSVTLYDDKIKVIAQLINANDEHVWSKEYEESFNDVIAVQNNVAQEVMKQLKITLSPQEEVILKKYPTENMEAYSLFLKGQNTRSLKAKSELFEQAIEIDSNFSDAYAELAYSYYRRTLYSQSYNPFTSRDKALNYANKALEKDSNTSLAWGVKGSLNLYLDWDKAEEYFKKAIALNPNDALTHIQYGLYFQLRPNPDINKYLEHLTISQKLNPLSIRQPRNYMRALLYNKKFEEAEAYLNKMGFLLSKNNFLQLKTELIAKRNKDWTTVIPYLKTKIEKDPNNAMLYYYLGYMYDGIFNDDETSITYHKKAYKKDSTNWSIAYSYVTLLIEGKKYEEAKKIMQTENFKLVFGKKRALKRLWYYYFHQKNNTEIYKISKDSLLLDQYLVQVLTYAQLGDQRKVDSINKRYPWGTGDIDRWRLNRARLHAILKDRDSMYYYLELGRFDSDNILEPNSRPEFDPYRNEERYKNLLRENYIPVPGE